MTYLLWYVVPNVKVIRDTRRFYNRAAAIRKLRRVNKLYFRANSSIRAYIEKGA